MAYLRLHARHDFGYTRWVTYHTVGRDLVSWPPLLNKLSQPQELRHVAVGTTLGHRQERILGSGIRPGEWGRKRLPLSVQAIHALLAPATPITDQRERLTGSGMEGMRQSKPTLQPVHNWCSATWWPSSPVA